LVALFSTVAADRIAALVAAALVAVDIAQTIL